MAQTLSLAEALARLQLDIPVVINNIGFSSELMTSPLAPVLKTNFLVMSPTVGFTVPATADLRAAYEATHRQQSPNPAVVDGWTAAVIMEKILEKACADHDLTREGVFRAKSSLWRLDLAGLTPPLDYSLPGVSPTEASYIGRIADVAGGLVMDGGPVRSPDLSTYRRNQPAGNRR